MIRRSWNDEDPKRWRDSQREYREHLARIRPNLPAVLAEFVEQYSLHDDRFAGILVVPGTPHGRDALVSIRVFRDGLVGAAALLTLHFVGVRGGIRPMPDGIDIHFFDIEMPRPGMFRMGFALDRNRRWNITFRDFAYFMHEYKGTV
jgi:hypothetical protein